MQIRNLERILKALANSRRLEILKFLRGKTANVGEIAEAIKLSFKSTSRHLSILAGADILEKDYVSNQVYYHLSPSPHTLVKKTLSIL